MKGGHAVALAAAAAAIGWLIWTQTQSQDQTGGFGAPQRQPPADNDLMRMAANPDPGAPVVCEPGWHHAGYTYTPHRYPRIVGGEITAAIHRGFSSMRIPSSADVQWMIAPPSEVMW